VGTLSALFGEELNGVGEGPSVLNEEAMPSIVGTKLGRWNARGNRFAIGEWGNAVKAAHCDQGLHGECTQSVTHVMVSPSRHLDAVARFADWSSGVSAGHEIGQTSGVIMGVEVRIGEPAVKQEPTVARCFVTSAVVNELEWIRRTRSPTS
jgi:hypothetical protein